MARGGSLHQEDLRKWNNFLLGLHAEISVGVVIKSRRNKIWRVTKTKIKFGALLLSLLALVTTFQQQLAVHQLLGMLNKIVSLYLVITH